MENTYWHKQTLAEPLYPDLIWSRPENRMHAGKLLILSGSAAGFATAGQAFATANTAGAGSVRMVLPDILRKSVPKEVQFELDFAPSVAHGSFSKNSLSDLLAHANWADAVLLPGGIGRNSETSVLLENFIEKYQGLLVIGEDAVEVFINNPKLLTARPRTVVVADFSQLQKMWHKLTAGSSVLKFGMPLANLVESLHKVSLDHSTSFITLHQDILFVAYRGQVSTTPCTEQIWRVQTAAISAVWAMQHESKLFEALTSAQAKTDHT